MIRIEPSINNPDTHFKLNGLEYDKDHYTLFYRNLSLVNGQVDKLSVKVGLRSKFNLVETLVSPTDITNWSDGVSNFTNLDLLLQYILDLINLSVGVGANILFIDQPTPRTEINEGDSITIDVFAENATAVSIDYKTPAGTYTNIGAATDLGGGSWRYTGWTATAVPTAIRATATYADSSTAIVENQVYGVSLYDTFTDTNGTNITAHTPDGNLSGNGWNVVSGDWSISSNYLTINTADTNTHFLTHEANSPNAIMEVSCPSPVLNTTQYVMRYQDANNHILILFVSDGRVRIGKRSGGVFSLYFETATNFYTAGTKIQFWLIDNVFNIVYNNTTTGGIDLIDFSNQTKYGIARAGANSPYKYDDFKIIPISLPETTSEVAYTATKSNTFVIPKGQQPPNDSGGVGGQEIVKVGSTNYMVFAIKNSSGSWAGLTYATSPDTDIHNWTRYSGYIVNAGSKQIADCSVHYDGTNFNVIYSDRLTGIIYYRSGATLESLGAESEIINLTSSGLFARHPNILFKDNTYYVYIDVRLFQPAGEFGDVYVCSGDSLSNLSGFRQVLNYHGYGYEQCDITSPSVRYNESNGFYEMVYTGFNGSGPPYKHEGGLAVSKNPLTPFTRIQTTPIIPVGGVGSIDEGFVFDVSWFPGEDIIYYVADDSTFGSTDSYDGITYATLS